MQKNIPKFLYKNKLRILFSIVLFEYLLFIFSGVSFSFLIGDTFFKIEADPVSWLFYLINLPQLITSHQWLGISLDCSIVILLLLIIRNPYNNRLAIALFLLLLLFYVTFMGYHAHRNYQFGFFILFIPFLFKNDTSKTYAFEATRYFLLFFYLSAALLKLSNDALSGNSLFSHLISGQFTPYFLESNTGIRTDFNLYLVAHPSISYILYLFSFLIELSVIIGFFTKRFDKYLAVMLLLFHFCNWFIMDIAPFGQIGFICLLLLGKELKLKD